MNKTKTLKLFKQLFPQHKLCCIQLNGFSHKMFLREKYKKDFFVYEFSHYTKCTRDNENANTILRQFSHFMYQNNAQEIIFERLR